jgi:hypothetical protein
MASIIGRDGGTPGAAIRSHNGSRNLLISSTAILMLLLGSLLLAGCSKPGNNAAGTDNTASTAAVAPAEADTKPSADCVERGKAASHYAEERDQGISLDKVILEIEKGSLPDEENIARKDVARQLYTDPFAAKLSPENAGNNFQGACTTENAKRHSNMQNITAAADVEKALVLFKTYSGQSLTDLLSSYGITIQALQIHQSNGSGTYKSGDTIYTLTLGATAHADTPCRLQKWVGGDITPTPEFVRRGPAFPLIRPEDDDPLIYWAATGKCSTALNN